MKIFIDTNVVLDVFLNRAGLVVSSKAVLKLYDEGHLLGASLLTFTTGNYIISKEYPVRESRKFLKQLRNIIVMVPATLNVLDKAIDSDFIDFEDAIQYYTALENGYELICTRNVRDFRKSEIPILTPEEVVKRFE